MARYKQNAADTDYEHFTVKLDKGNYNMSDLEIAIAKKFKSINDLWQAMNIAALGTKAKPNGDTGTAIAHAQGVADPAVASQWMDTATNPPLTFLELQELVGPKVVYAPCDTTHRPTASRSR